MSTAIITGSAGLIGSEAVVYFADQGLDVIGIDNDMRSTFFGREASTAWKAEELQAQLGDRYRHFDLDIRNREAVLSLFEDYGRDLKLVVHAAAQPSHDWAAKEPFTDFDINAVGTLNVLEAARLHAPEAAFVFTSTNKVYGDRPNELPLVELETRWEVAPEHPYFKHGIDETMSVD